MCLVLGPALMTMLRTSKPSPLWLDLQDLTLYLNVFIMLSYIHWDMNERDPGCESVSLKGFKSKWAEK